ncbi:hypothetical protein SFUMM280S_06550 [Streptomyces fumanus]
MSGGDTCARHRSPVRTTARVSAVSSVPPADRPDEGPEGSAISDEELERFLREAAEGTGTPPKEPSARARMVARRLREEEPAPTAWRPGPPVPVGTGGRTRRRGLLAAVGVLIAALVAVIAVRPRCCWTGSAGTRRRPARPWRPPRGRPAPTRSGARPPPAGRRPRAPSCPRRPGRSPVSPRRRWRGRCAARRSSWSPPTSTRACCAATGRRRRSPCWTRRAPGCWPRWSGRCARRTAPTTRCCCSPGSTRPGRGSSATWSRCAAR